MCAKGFGEAVFAVYQPEKIKKKTFPNYSESIILQSERLFTIGKHLRQLVFTVEEILANQTEQCYKIIK